MGDFQLFKLALPVLLGLRSLAGPSGSLFDLANGYASTSNNGNIVSQTSNSSISRSFLYDGLNRLTEAAQSSSWTEGYAYDRFGNRAVTTRTSPLPGLTGETPDQLTDYNTSNNRISVFTYDARGNIAATPAWTANYDGENRQESVMPTGGSWMWYGYDASNRRIVKTDGTNGTLYFYDAFGRLAAEDDGTTLIEHIAGSKVVENSSTGRQYYTKDHLGSTRLITDGSGSPVSAHDYLPFGEELGGSGCATLPGGVKFTGQYRDEESCLDYFVNRYVSSAQGRFTSPDKLSSAQRAHDPQTWNLYTYVRNNPLRHVDPTGEDWACVSSGGVSLGCEYFTSGTDFFGYGIGSSLGSWDCRNKFINMGDFVMANCFAYSHEDACSMLSYCPPPPEPPAPPPCPAGQQYMNNPLKNTWGCDIPLFISPLAYEIAQSLVPVNNVINSVCDVGAFVFIGASLPSSFSGVHGGAYLFGGLDTESVVSFGAIVEGGTQNAQVAFEGSVGLLTGGDVTKLTFFSLGPVSFMTDLKTGALGILAGVKAGVGEAGVGVWAIPAYDGSCINQGRASGETRPSNIRRR